MQRQLANSRSPLERRQLAAFVRFYFECSARKLAYTDTGTAFECDNIVITWRVAMLTTIRRLGNSRGILIPKPLLKQAGLEDQAEILVEGNTLIVRRPKPAPRAGWAEASKEIAARGEDRLVLGDFANEADEDWTW
jgi:antitoxin MazE